VPSAYYGVESLRLGNDAVDGTGPNAGMYELASASEICAYFNSVLDDVLLRSGQVRFLGMHEYLVTGSSGPRLVSRLTGETIEVTVRCKLVNATYLEGKVPSRHTPPFDVDPGVRLMPINGLVELSEPASRFVVLGAGKTGIDACLWLLDRGVAPERIQWIRPRDMWMFNRARLQPLDQVASFLEGGSLEVEALASATSVDDLFRRLEEHGQLLRIDEQVEPTMFRCATVSEWELHRLRQITDVVRLGHVRRIEPDKIILQHGDTPTDADTVHVDCTAEGVPTSAIRPVFEPGQITIQPVEQCLPCFSAALIGYIEASRDEDGEKNSLCPPNPYPNTAMDWLRTFAGSMAADAAWNTQPDVREWVDHSRLHLMRGVADKAGEPRIARALERFDANAESALSSVQRLQAEAAALPH
jgi:hypothetical protein